MTEKLKKCPICGSELTVHGPDDWKPTFYDPDSGGEPYYAICDCGFEFHKGHYDYDDFVKALNTRAADENPYLDGAKYAIYEIMKEADIPGSQEIRDSGDTIDGMCSQVAEKIRLEIYSADENPPLTLDELGKMYRQPIWIESKSFKGWAIILRTIGLKTDYVQADGKVKLRHANGYRKTWIAYRRKLEVQE